MIKTTYKARKAFAIFNQGYFPGDEVPIEELKRVPNWKKLERGGFITEEKSDAN